jgi:hypothetical protein
MYSQPVLTREKVFLFFIFSVIGVTRNFLGATYEDF